MKVSVANAGERGKFEDFVRQNSLGQIQQSWAWGEFQAGLPGRGAFWPVMVEDEQGHVRATALLVRQALPMGKCWFSCMYGPLAEPDTPVWHELVAFVTRLGRREGAVFWRIEPPFEVDMAADDNVSVLAGFRAAHAGHAPRWTLVIDLTKSEDEILAEMKQKGRYNIRLAQKRGVEVVSARGATAVEQGLVGEFCQLLADTTARDGFSGHGPAFYEKMLLALAEGAEVFVARFQGRALGAIIVTYFGKTATYYYGASSDEKRELMAPYLLQWRAIQAAKQAGYAVYDLFGIAPVISVSVESAENLAGTAGAVNSDRLSEAKNSLPTIDKSHPWAKVTEFKLKFGGRVIRYLAAQEKVFRGGLYWAMRVAKKLRG